MHVIYISKIKLNKLEVEKQSCCPQNCLQSCRTDKQGRKYSDFSIINLIKKMQRGPKGTLCFRLDNDNKDSLSR